MFRFLLFLPGLALLALGCSPMPGHSPPSTPATMTANDKEIVIDNFTFSPPEVTVPVGTRITWINHDDVPHTATSTVKPRTIDSGTLDTDEKYSFTFESAGVYEYFCAVHPKMTGRVTVK